MIREAEGAPVQIPHTFIVQVEDRPGALNRVVSLFRRRNVNITSLAVGTTEQPGVSRVTLVISADAGVAARMVMSLYRLVDVLHVEDVTHAKAIVREMVFIKLGAERRSEVLLHCEVFRARVVDLGPESLTIESTGAQDKMDGLIEALRPFGILELVRTGAVAMTRGVPTTIRNGSAATLSQFDESLPHEAPIP